MNKTQQIFGLATFETQTGLEGYGLTSAGVDKVAGCIGLHASNKADFINEAKQYAEAFVETVESAIESLKGDAESRGNAVPASDLEVLQSMLNWAYDEKELEKLASEDWDLYHEEEVA